MPPNDEIAEIPSGNEALLALVTVHKGNHFAVRDAETPIEFTIDGFGFAICAACAGIDWLVVTVVRRAERVENVFARAGAGIDKAAGL